MWFLVNRYLFPCVGAPPLRLSIWGIFKAQAATCLLGESNFSTEIALSIFQLLYRKFCKTLPNKISL